MDPACQSSATPTTDTTWRDCLQEIKREWKRLRTCPLSEETIQEILRNPRTLEEFDAPDTPPELSRRRIAIETLASLDREITLLKENGFLTEADISSLDAHLPSPQICEIKRKMIHVAIGRALQLEKAFPDHILFLHGQESSLFMWMRFLKYLIACHSPEEGHDYLLRFPIPPRDGGIEAIIEEMGKHGRKDWDADMRRVLLSVDALQGFSRWRKGESAMDFVYKDRSEASCWALMYRLPEEALTALYPKASEEEIKNYADRLRAIMDDVSDKIANDERHFWVGNYIVICVPSPAIEKVCYQAHDLGKPCYHHGGEPIRDRLIRFQKQTVAPIGNCTSFESSQFRLYLPDFKEADVKVIPIQRHKGGALERAARAKLKELAQEIHAGLSCKL